MAFFVNPGKDWENNLTEEDIAKLEAQGCDVNGLRNRPSVPEDDEEGEETFDNPTRLDRLKPYLQTPRDMETPFFRAVAGNAGCRKRKHYIGTGRSGKENWFCQ